MAMTYIISEICGDWSLHIKGPGTSNNFLFFKSRNNAELVKSILEWEDAHPNKAVPYKPTLTPPNEWVSVEERLPGVSGNYICAVKDKNGSVWTIPAEWSLEMKMWIGAFGEIKNIVTHWMPLPEPPKEESNETD